MHLTEHSQTNKHGQVMSQFKRNKVAATTATQNSHKHPSKTQHAKQIKMKLKKLSKELTHSQLRDPPPNHRSNHRSHNRKNNHHHHLISTSSISASSDALLTRVRARLATRGTRGLIGIQRQFKVRLHTFKHESNLSPSR